MSNMPNSQYETAQAGIAAIRNVRRQTALFSFLMSNRCSSYVRLILCLVLNIWPRPWRTVQNFSPNRLSIPFFSDGPYEVRARAVLDVTGVTDKMPVITDIFRGSYSEIKTV